jgi:hypothetical protein
LTLHRDARCQCNIKRNSLSIDDYLRPSNLNKSHGVPAWFPCLCSYSCHPRGSAMPGCRSLSSLGYSPDSFYRGLLLNPGTLHALGPRCCLELWVRKQSLRWQPLKRWVSNRNGYSHAVRSRRQNPAISRWFLGENYDYGMSSSFYARCAEVNGCNSVDVGEAALPSRIPHFIWSAPRIIRAICSADLILPQTNIRSALQL